MSTRKYQHVYEKLKNKELKKKKKKNLISNFSSKKVRKIDFKQKIY